MKKFIILLVSLASCTMSVSKKETESYVIVDMWKETPLSVHQEISPRYKALLNNGDTVPCSPNARLGDTVYYKYYKVK